VSLAALRRSRKYVLLAIFVVAAMVTPPDVISQITLGVPLYALFEIGILLAWLAERKKRAG
jgi:sec-independent protein translocase protein TatC